MVFCRQVCLRCILWLWRSNPVVEVLRGETGRLGCGGEGVTALALGFLLF